MDAIANSKNNNKINSSIKQFKVNTKEINYQSCDDYRNNSIKTNNSKKKNGKSVRSSSLSSAQTTSTSSIPATNVNCVLNSENNSTTLSSPIALLSSSTQPPSLSSLSSLTGSGLTASIETATLASTTDRIVQGSNAQNCKDTENALPDTLTSIKLIQNAATTIDPNILSTPRTTPANGSSTNNDCDMQSLIKTNAIHNCSNNNNDQRSSYNDFVNLLICDQRDVVCGESDNALETYNCVGDNQSKHNHLDHDAQHDHNDDTKQPLLLAYEHEKTERKPKSIVKSPSTRSFGGCDKSIDKQSLANGQFTNFDYERPVLHVQFLQQQNDSILSLSGQSSQAHRAPSTLYGVSICNSGSGGGLTGTIKSKGNTILKGDGECSSPGGCSVTSSSTSSSSTNSSSGDDEASSIDQYSEAHPPDGGWGWVVVFASFIVNLIADGITFSFGVIYVEFLNYFNEGKAKTAWIGSLFMAMPLLSGPVASFLTDRYGCRNVTIAGSILSSLGFIISSQSNSMEMLFFTFGILAGIGLSLCYVAAVVIVAYYFDKKRSFATGLSVCGSGIGTFIFAPLIQYLLETYGWRGTCLILAGLFLNMSVCGMLMRDLEWTTHRAKLKAKQRKKNKLAISADSFSVSNSTNTGGTASNLQQNDDNNGAGDDNNTNDMGKTECASPRLFSSLITLPTFMRNGEKIPMEVLELMATHRNVVHHQNYVYQNYAGLAHSRSFSEPLSASRHSNGMLSPEQVTTFSPITNGAINGDNSVRYSKTKNQHTIQNEQAFLQWLKRNGNSQKDNRHATAAYLRNLKMHRHSLTYRGAMLNINRYRLRASSCPDIYRNSMTTIAKEKFHWAQGITDFKILLLDMLDFSYFADIRFVLFALSNFLLYTWYDVPYVYLADNAIEMGFSETDASYLISLIGIVNMFGEIILGWCGDKKFISPGVIYAICMGLCGVVTALVPLLKSYAALSTISGLFGLFIAANYALTSIILVELITLERFTNAYGLLLLVQGVANLVGPPLAGWITDVTRNYDLSFYLAGFFIALSGGLMVILPIYGQFKKYRQHQQRTHEHGVTIERKKQILFKTSTVDKCNGTIYSKDIVGV